MHPRCWDRVALTGLFLVCGSFEPGLFAQSTGIFRLPVAQLRIEPPPGPITAPQHPVTVTLFDADGKPVVARDPVHLKVTATGAAVNQTVLVIPAGQSSATLNVSRQGSGLAHVSVENIAQGPLLRATVPLSFVGDEFSPKKPFSIALDIVPGTKLKPGLKATLIARMIDADGREFPAQANYRINFPELSATAKLEPPEMLLPKDVSNARMTVTSDSAQSLVVKPSVTPYLSVQSHPSSIEFESPVWGAVLVPKHSYIEAFWPPKIETTVGIIDIRNNWYASDEGRTLRIQGTPSSQGVFENEQIQIPKGVEAIPSFYIPLREGKITIKVSSGGLQSPETTIEFRYRIWFFLFMAALGGIGGGIVRDGLAGKLTRKELLPGAAVGCLVGVLVYALAPALDIGSTSPDLQAGGRVFLAFFYGFIGGGVGFAIFKPLLAKYQK